MSAKSVTLGQSNVEQATEYDTLLPPMRESEFDAVMAVERERCAKVCDEVAAADKKRARAGDKESFACARAAQNCARKIRSLSSLSE